MISIEVKAVFWQNPLFYLSLFILMMAAVILATIRRKNNQLRKKEIEHQLIVLEQKALQSMMNPHFIFNALGSIQNYLLQNKPGEAGLYLSQFARLIRQNLNAINAANISLEDEVDRLKNYLDLEKLRMENKFDYFIGISEQVEDGELLIPSMIIQPFVENAIWHGIAGIGEKGMIRILFTQPSEQQIVVRIEDNGIGVQRSSATQQKKSDHLHLGIGITRKRLEILGVKHGISTSVEINELHPGSSNPGTVVELVLPAGV